MSLSLRKGTVFKQFGTRITCDNMRQNSADSDNDRIDIHLDNVF